MDQPIGGKPPPGQPGAGAARGAGAGGGAPSGAGAPGGNTFQSWLNTQFGGGNPFGMRGNYSDPNNPIYAAAKRTFDQNLAAGRSRYGASGLGDSSREALFEADANADLAAQIAQIGEGAYQSDANRGLQAYQAGSNYNLAANQQMSALGDFLTKIGINEQNLPLIQALLPFLQTFNQQQGSGTSSGSSSTGSGFLGF